MNTLALVLEAMAATVVAVFGLCCAKNWKKWKRRKPGVYLVRMDHHVKRWKRINGYVGESVNVDLRKLQHLGTSRFHPETGKAKGNVMHKVKGQPWTDLRPVWHWVRLPWWLGFKWFLRPMETLMILFCWPIYNDAKNRWNPRRIPLTLAKAQREARDRGDALYRMKVAGSHAARWVCISGGTAAIVIGFVGYIMTR